MLKKIGFICILLFLHFKSCAQSDANQLWTDLNINKSLPRRFSFDCDLSYRTILSSSDKWHSYNIIPRMEKSLGRHWDLLFYAAYIHTLQQTGDNTLEIRPSLGVRFRFMPFRKLQVRLLARLEYRNQYTFETTLWTQDLRSRFRLEGTYFINGESFAVNHLWYILSDVEFFKTVDKELEERFSDRMLLRLGVGYKLSDRWRFENIYTYQYAKNTIDGGFSNEEEGIIRLRFRYYFN